MSKRPDDNDGSGGRPLDLSKVKRKATYQLKAWGYDSLRVCLFDIYQKNRSADWEEAKRILLLEQVRDVEIWEAAIKDNSDKLRADWYRWKNGL